MSGTLDQFAVDEARWLEALDREWGRAYLVSVNGGQWYGTPVDGSGDAITAARLLTVREVSALLELDRSYAARLCQRGTLPAIREGRRYLVPESAVLAYRDRPVYSRQGGSGKWVKVAESLRGLIAGLQPGDRLPGLGDLAFEHGTSVTPPAVGFYVREPADGPAGGAR